MTRAETDLTVTERKAVEQVGRQLYEACRYHDALAVYGTLLGQDPLEARYWRAVATLHQRVGQHPTAVACFEAAAALGRRDGASTRAEARSLRAMGEQQLADELEQRGEPR